MRRAVFIDKDGTLLEDVPYNVDPMKVSFTPDALEGLRLLHQRGFLLVVVTNQPGVAQGNFKQSALLELERFLTARLADAGAPLAGFFACPHRASAYGCSCRKPQPGLLHQAAAKLDIDLLHSWMVGDILNDIEAGRRAGCRTVFMDVGNETEWVMSVLRSPHHRASTLLEAAHRILGDPANRLQAQAGPRLCGRGPTTSAGVQP
jgi:D-glycero-D-manno-heptose 1,7-bisphosphate phosphatase